MTATRTFAVTVQITVSGTEHSAEVLKVTADQALDELTSYLHEECIYFVGANNLHYEFTDVGNVLELVTDPELVTKA